VRQAADADVTSVATLPPAIVRDSSHRQGYSRHWGSIGGIERGPNRPCQLSAAIPEAKKGQHMAQKRKYSRSVGKDVENEMHRYKRGKAKSGPGGKGGKVKSRKQAIAIGLSKARKKGKKIPRKK
jgi:uncharacterized protein DUF6496